MLTQRYFHVQWLDLRIDVLADLLVRASFKPELGGAILADAYVGTNSLLCLSLATVSLVADAHWQSAQVCARHT